MSMERLAAALALLVIVGLVACSNDVKEERTYDRGGDGDSGSGDGDGDDGDTDDGDGSGAAYTVGGTVSGLTGPGLVLQNNGGDDLSISADGVFTFVTPLADGASYDVTIETQPAGQVCTASANSGSIAGQNVSSVLISCVTPLPWTKQEGTEHDDEGYSIATDGDDNLFVAGYTYGALHGNTSAGGGDLFVIKYDGSGTRSWTQQLGTAQGDIAHGVATDAAGNVYVTGYTHGNLGNVNAGDVDIFIVKYDGSGALQWIRQFGTTRVDIAYAITVDTSGNLYVAGDTHGTLEPGGPYANPDATGHTSDLFVIKYDAAGNLLWIRQLGTAKLDGVFGVTTDASGAVYLAGHTRGDLDGNTNADPSGATQDVVVVRYDGDGNKQWTKTFGSAADDWASGIAINATTGHAIVSGCTNGVLQGASAGGSDLFMANVSHAGLLLSVVQYGSSGDDWPTGLVIDGDDDVYLAGATNGELDGNANAGWGDIILVKYDASAVRQWTRQLGSAGYELARAIAIDGGGNLYLAGASDGDLDGNTNFGQGVIKMDVVVVKYDSDGMKQ